MENRVAEEDFLITTVAAFTLAAFAGAVQAGETDKDDGWKFTFSSYFWEVSLKGISTVGQNRSDVDISFSDIPDNPQYGRNGGFTTREGT